MLKPGCTWFFYANYFSLPLPSCIISITFIPLSICIMSDIKEILNALIHFRDARNWSQFHNPKDLALAISIEAGELNELYLWKKEAEVSQVDKRRVQEELADILAYAFLLAEKYDFNIKEMVLDKIELNHLKYPVDKARNSAKKYKDLE